MLFFVKRSVLHIVIVGRTTDNTQKQNPLTLFQKLFQFSCDIFMPRPYRRSITGILPRNIYVESVQSLNIVRAILCFELNNNDSQNVGSVPSLIKYVTYSSSWYRSNIIMVDLDISLYRS